MKEQNYWQQFLSTGSVEDYLSFKNKKEREAAPAEKEASAEDNRYAGICKANRNGFEDSAYRGIR